MDKAQTKVHENLLLHGLLEHAYAQAARKVDNRLKGIDVEKEYELIKQKKSNLPSVTRRIIVGIIERKR